MSFGQLRTASPIASYYYETGTTERLPFWQLAFICVLILSLLSSAGAYVFSRSIRVSAASFTPQTSETSVVAATPVAEPLPNPKNEALQAAIDQWVQAHGNATWGVVVQPLGAEAPSASVHPDEVFAIASLYKLFLLESLHAKVPGQTWAQTNFNGRSYAQCVDIILRLSDNPCAEALGAILGWSKVEQFIHQQGHTHTKLAQELASGTAQDTSRMLLKLYEGQGLDEAGKTVVFDALAAPKKAEGIRRGCMSCTVYNKTGDMNGHRHDGAIVIKDGKVYSVVVLSKNGTWQQIADLSSTISAHL